MNTTIKNDILTVVISSKGAEIQSIVKDGREYLWNGDPHFWTGIAPVMFPICGGLKNDEFTYKGKTYSVEKHGFAMNCEFTLEASGTTQAVFLLESSEETKASYPFDFEFRCKYSLHGSTLSVIYEITNKTDGEMFVSVGAHEAYMCPEGIEEYSIVFDKPETLSSYILDGNLLEHNSVPILKEECELKLKHEYFTVDALVFKDVKSRGCNLVHRASGRTVRIEFEGFDYFLLWQKHTARFICIEPWCGIQDPVDTDGNFAKKEGINRISKGGVFSRTHTITF